MRTLNVMSFDRPVVTADSPTETKSGQRVPKEDVVLDQRKQLDLNGIAVNDLAVASFVAFLRESGVFESVELKSSVSQNFNKHETRGYEVTCIYLRQINVHFQSITESEATAYHGSRCGSCRIGCNCGRWISFLLGHLKRGTSSGRLRSVLTQNCSNSSRHWLQPEKTQSVI